MCQGGREGCQLVEHLYHTPRSTVLCTQESLKTLPVQMAVLTNCSSSNEEVSAQKAPL